MSKLLLLLVAVVVVYLAWKGFARKRGEPPASSQAEVMVPCAHCGVNLPHSEALRDGGRFFCSEEHRRLDAG